MSSNNRRIAKNTLLLYGRMLLMMAINLYTSRLILKALGVEDYGIYNVVGGVVAMFSVLTGSLSAAISRYITFELGKANKERLKLVFTTSVNVQAILIVILVLLMETLGICFLNHKMTVPYDRVSAANLVYHISVVTFVINLWSIPYNACIIAHERMSAFAYISLFDAAFKLFIAFVIVWNPFDRLVYYAVLICIAGLVQRLLYARYCKKNFEECEYSFCFDKQVTKEIFGFAGWNFIGAASAVLRDQGGNILLNIFYGPIVNAARGIAVSVNNAVSGFVANFMTALNPQITKSYANGDNEYMFNLAFRGARFSYYILSLVAFPVIVTTPYLLGIWLGNYPEITIVFVRLVLIFALSETLATPLVTIMLATGDIRNYQLVVGGLQMLNLPVSYVFLKNGYPPETLFVTSIVISIICEIARLFMLKYMVNLSIRNFLRDVYFNVILVSVVSLIFPLIIYTILGTPNIYSFLIVFCASLLSSIVVIYSLGCNNEERSMMAHFVGRIKNKFKK